MLNYYLVIILALIKLCNCAEKVHLSVYLESLCPDSKRFVNRQLAPTYQSVPQLFNVEFVPFGNSWVRYDPITKDTKFQCQHGPRECFGNKLQSCLVTMAANNTQLSVDFIDCMFSDRQWTQPDIAAQNCATKLSVNWDQLNECALGPTGTQIELVMANKTNSLNPPQNWIPWITLDGVHTNDIQTRAETDLKKLICDSYKGIKPDQCNEKAADLKFIDIPYFILTLLFDW